MISMSVKIHVKKECRFEGCTFITGFHSVIGEAGYIAVRHIIKNLDPERIGIIETKLLPPFVWFKGGGLALPFELFKYENFVMLFPRVLPHADEHKEFAFTIAEWVVKEKFSKAILIGGLDSRFRQGSEAFRIVATRAGYPEALKLGAPFLDEELGVFGPLALMLAYFELSDFPAITILPFAERGRPDPRAAAVAIDVLKEKYGLPVETESLIQDAKEIEAEIEKILKQQERELGGGEEGMYI
ncbi:MAG: PAC2 family protein [Candidatus Jordarchaeales archaeon]